MSTNHIKIGASAINSISAGDFSMGVSGGADYGPTSETGFYNGIEPPVGGYTIYVSKPSQGPSIHVPRTDSECLLYLNKYGANASNISDALTWASTQTNILVRTSEYGVGDLPNNPTATPTPIPATSTPTPTPTSSSINVGDWYLFLNEGTYTDGEVYTPGNIFFTSGLTQNLYVTNNPNFIDYTSVIRLNTINSASVDKLSLFQDIQSNGGQVSFSQNGNVVKFNVPANLSLLYNISNYGGYNQFTLDTSVTQIQNSANSFVSGTPITISLDINPSTPTPTPLPATATPTPTPISATATPTPTPEPATATPTPTPFTATATPTPTPLAATATPTPTPTQLPATATPTPTPF